MEMRIVQRGPCQPGNNCVRRLSRELQMKTSHHSVIALVASPHCAKAALERWIGALSRMTKARLQQQMPGANHAPAFR
jgi:hypothetical protein